MRYKRHIIRSWKFRGISSFPMENPGPIIRSFGEWVDGILQLESLCKLKRGMIHPKRKESSIHCYSALSPLYFSCFWAHNGELELDQSNGSPSSPSTFSSILTLLYKQRQQKLFFSCCCYSGWTVWLSSTAKAGNQMKVGSKLNSFLYNFWIERFEAVDTHKRVFVLKSYPFGM